MRAETVEAEVRRLFAERQDPVEFTVATTMDDGSSGSLSIDWRGSEDTATESGGDQRSNERAHRRVEVVIDMLSPGTEEVPYREAVALPDATRHWAIKVDILEGAFGIAGSLAQGELKNRTTGQIVKGEWETLGGGGGIDLPIPSVAPGVWTDFETRGHATFQAFESSPVTLFSIAAGVGMGYGYARFGFTDLMSSNVTLHGVVFNQWGAGGSVTSGDWEFTEAIPSPPVEDRVTTSLVPVEFGSQYGEVVRFDTESSEIDPAARLALAHLVLGIR